MILEKMYSIPALAFVAVLFVGWYVASTLAYRSKLSKLGEKPRRVPFYLPFGIDTLIEGIQVRSIQCNPASLLFLNTHSNPQFSELYLRILLIIVQSDRK